VWLASVVVLPPGAVAQTEEQVCGAAAAKVVEYYCAPPHVAVGVPHFFNWLVCID
jgi:hypothetical protein